MGHEDTGGRVATRGTSARCRPVCRFPYAPGMIVVGLTGGIGAGKSTVSALLAELGAVVVDADAIVHEVQAPGHPVLAADRRALRAGHPPAPTAGWTARRWPTSSSPTSRR